MHSNQIGLFMIGIYLLFTIAMTALFIDKVKLNFWVKFVLVILMVLVWFAGFIELINLLIHDT
jgi:hypothetical protein